MKLLTLVVLTLALCYCVDGSCSDVSRSGWRAREPTSTSDMNTPVDLVFIHHTAGASCSSRRSCARVARDVQRYHMSLGWADVGYNFLVGGDGRVYEGRGWDRVGSHTRNYNSRSVAICFMGSFTSSSPTGRALSAAQGLLDCGLSRGKLSSDYRLYGHRQARGPGTQCPGDTLYGIIQGWSHYSDGTP